MRTELIDRIVVNPQIMTGKPVELVLQKLAQNPDVNEFLLDYPRLMRDDIRACLEYACSIRTT